MCMIFDIILVENHTNLDKEILYVNYLKKNLDMSKSLLIKISYVLINSFYETHT